MDEEIDNENYYRPMRIYKNQFGRYYIKRGMGKKYIKKLRDKKYLKNIAEKYRKFLTKDANLLKIYLNDKSSFRKIKRRKKPKERPQKKKIISSKTNFI